MIDPKKYFTNVDGSWVFIGDTLDVHVPQRYETHGCLEVSDTVYAMCVVDMVIDGQHQLGFELPAMVTMMPSDISHMVKNNAQFTVLHFFKDDVFIKENEVIRNKELAYVMFYEFVGSVCPLDYMTYLRHAFMFDSAQKYCGVKFPASHVMFEIMTAHLFRTKDNLSIPHRLDKPGAPYVQIPLRDVAHAGMSTTSKITGAYMNDGINAALLDENETSSKIEDIFRL